MLSTMFSPEILTWVVMPALIFLARVIDVSIGTVRVIFIARGYKYLAPILGFFEVLIWLLAIQQIFMHLDNVFWYVAYAGGFAAGTYSGIILEEKLSIGRVIIRIITRKNATRLVSHLRKRGYGLTVTDAQGIKGSVKVIFLVVDRHEIKDTMALVKKYNPSSFYTIEDVRHVREITKNIKPEIKKPDLNHRKVK